jgi:F0F1-type ATP synthase membrane subunit b/b'
MKRKYFIIKSSENEIDSLREGDYNEIETVVDDILKQVDNQTKEEMKDGSSEVLPDV